MASGVEGFRNGVDEFMSSSTVLPPSTWDPKTRVDPPDNLPETNQRINPVRYGGIRSDNLPDNLLIRGSIRDFMDKLSSCKQHYTNEGNESYAQNLESDR